MAAFGPLRRFAERGDPSAIEENPTFGGSGPYQYS
jgi:hypothetical protein